MLNRFSVTAECPSCGAPLDFSEGSNAVRCGHCRCNLLITGRGQVLSYYVSPRLDVHRAVARAAAAPECADCRMTNPQLYFIPYYNFIGYEVRWEERREQQPDALHGEDDRLDHFDYDGSAQRDLSVHIVDLFRTAGSLVGRLFRKERTDEEGGESFVSPGPVVHAQPASVVPSHTLPFADRPALKSTLKFCDRYVSRNFLAVDLGEAGMYSLGVRPGVVRLQLFRREDLASLGSVVEARLPLPHGIPCGPAGDSSAKILYRATLGEIISLIYFPYWVVECARADERSLIVVDAVSESVVRRDLPASFRARLSESTTGDPTVLTFRQLVCPNCGWDLPVRPDDVVFFCSACRRAWQIRKADLVEVTYRIAARDGGKREGLPQYLPFWSVSLRPDSGDETRLLVPAFRYRSLKTLADLALRMSHGEVGYESPDAASGGFSGCYYDEHDAMRLGRFVHAALMAKAVADIERAHREMPAAGGGFVVWVPFEMRGVNLVEPRTKISLLRNLVW